MHNKLRLSNRQAQYNRFLKECERRYGPFSLPEQKLSPLAECAWLSGFIDAEGCFHARLGKKTYKQRIQFHLGQKQDIQILYAIRDVFKKGSVSKYRPASSFQYTLTGIKNMSPLIEYVDRFPLRSKKAFLIPNGKRFWFYFSKENICLQAFVQSFKSYTTHK